MSIVEALMAVGRSDWSGGLAAAQVEAQADPVALLPAALVRFLSNEGARDVYADPVGFERFIGGGRNPELYRRTEVLLKELHAKASPTSVLDVGCGDGRVTAAVLGAGTQRIDLLEPSPALLQTAIAAVSVPPARRSVVPHNMTAAEFFDSSTVEAGWDLIQSTFAMHTMAPEGRMTVCRQIAMHTDYFVMVDFDVADFADGSLSHAEYAATRYEVGLAEYAGDEVVAQGFLMPVLIGQFDPARQRHTFEQSVRRWTADLSSAGFVSIVATPVLDYWWAPAFCIEARK
jgi:SAM-dependent methyltransferase